MSVHPAFKVMARRIGRGSQQVSLRPLVVSLQALLKKLDVTPMTVYNWRCGDVSFPPLPIVKISQYHVRYNLLEVKNWLLKYRPKRERVKSFGSPFFIDR
jgi:hypothetical protein